MLYKSRSHFNLVKGPCLISWVSRLDVSALSIHFGWDVNAFEGWLPSGVPTALSHVLPSPSRHWPSSSGQDSLGGNWSRPQQCDMRTARNFQWWLSPGRAPRKVSRAIRKLELRDQSPPTLLLSCRPIESRAPAKPHPKANLPQNGF